MTVSETPIRTDPSARHLASVMDLDSHEMIPTHLWESAFGESGAWLDELGRRAGGALSNAAENTLQRDDLAGDVVAIDHDAVWNLKGPAAPAAIDLRRRPEVLDEMGVARQLVFPGFALAGLFLRYHPEPHRYFGLDVEGAELDRFNVEKEIHGRAIVDAHNRWAVESAGDVSDDRVRPVAIVPTDDVAQMVATSEQLIADGIRCLWVPGGTPPAGTSPGDVALDPFWSVATQSNTPLVLHLGLEYALFRSQAWGANVPAFEPAVNSSLEFPVEPLRSATTLSYGSENFLCAMILGGVFERHPDLRFGVIECAAHWVGHLAEKLDIWAEQFASRLGSTLSMRPSQYIARNLRVTPFAFEPVDRYIERFPDLVDVYAYSTDYPHREGGKESKWVVYDKIARLGDEVVEKYFVSNGTWLLPD